MPETSLQAAAIGCSEEERVWGATLDAMELHLDEIRAGLAVGILPSPYTVPAPDALMPASLTPRALRIAAAQHDLEDALRERMAVVSSVLAGAFATEPAPEPVFVDRRG